MTHDGFLIAALIHVEQRPLGAGSFDLYRIAGRKDNEARVASQYLALVADDTARKMLESAVKNAGVGVGLFCNEKHDASSTFRGEGSLRLFLNIHYHTTVAEWAEYDMPTAIAHVMASIRSPASSQDHDYQWLTEFRKRVRSEEV